MQLNPRLRSASQTSCELPGVCWHPCDSPGMLTTPACLQPRIKGVNAKPVKRLGAPRQSQRRDAANSLWGAFSGLSHCVCHASGLPRATRASPLLWCGFDVTKCCVDRSRLTAFALTGSRWWRKPDRTECAGQVRTPRLPIHAACFASITDPRRLVPADRSKPACGRHGISLLGKTAAVLPGLIT